MVGRWDLAAAVKAGRPAAGHLWSLHIYWTSFQGLSHFAFQLCDLSQGADHYWTEFDRRNCVRNRATTFASQEIIALEFMALPSNERPCGQLGQLRSYHSAPPYSGSFRIALCLAYDNSSIVRFSEAVARGVIGCCVTMCGYGRG